MTKAEDDKKLYLTLGSLKTGVDNLGKKVDDVKTDVRDDLREFGAKLDTVKDGLVELNGRTVKQGDCVARVQSLHSAINGLQAGLSRKQTRDDYPAVQQAITTEVPIEAGERSLSGKIKDNIGLIVAVLTLLGLLVGGSIKVVRFMVRVEDLITKSNTAKPKIIRVTNLDAGIKSKK